MFNPNTAGEGSRGLPSGDTLCEGHPSWGCCSPPRPAAPQPWGPVRPSGDPWSPHGLPGGFWATGLLPGAARRTAHPAHTKDGSGSHWAPPGRSPSPFAARNKNGYPVTAPTALTQDGGARALRRALASSQHGGRKARAAGSRWRRSP